jgi:hypothetical protein
MPSIRSVSGPRLCTSSLSDCVVKVIEGLDLLSLKGLRGKGMTPSRVDNEDAIVADSYAGSRTS